MQTASGQATTDGNELNGIFDERYESVWAQDVRHKTVRDDS